MTLDTRLMNYSGSALPYVPYTVTKEMLRAKAEIVASNCEALDGDALAIRVRIWEGLARRHTILMQEGL